jgi:ADP-ribose pyrophosphatase YjhB (NUDIX family)
MFIKIYFNEKPLYLCDEIDEFLKKEKQKPATIYVDEINETVLKNMLIKVVENNVDAAILFNNSLPYLQQLFFSQFTAIEAAGGLVKNEKEELLFIYRLHKWDLPKGKIEEGEAPMAAALREVTEETGLHQLTIKNKLCETYHTYKAYGKHFLKTTHWYSMNCTSNQTLIPQQEEDITEVKWINKSHLDDVLSNTYPSIKEVTNSFFEIDK